MKQDISSLVDGELEGDEAARVIRSLAAEEHKDTWNLYHAIGEAIRGQPPRSLDRSAAVIERLRAEPTVLAPRRRVLETTFGRIALAAAASVATVGVVSWIGIQGGAPGTTSPVVAKGAPATGITAVSATKAAPAPAAQPADVQEYLAAHRQIPSSDVRTVSNRGAAAAR